MWHYIQNSSHLFPHQNQSNSSNTETFEITWGLPQYQEFELLTSRNMNIRPAIQTVRIGSKSPFGINQMRHMRHSFLLSSCFCFTFAANLSSRKLIASGDWPGWIFAHDVIRNHTESSAQHYLATTMQCIRTLCQIGRLIATDRRGRVTWVLHTTWDSVIVGHSQCCFIMHDVSRVWPCERRIEITAPSSSSSSFGDARLSPFCTLCVRLIISSQREGAKYLHRVTHDPKMASLPPVVSVLVHPCLQTVSFFQFHRFASILVLERLAFLLLESGTVFRLIFVLKHICFNFPSSLENSLLYSSLQFPLAAQNSTSDSALWLTSCT